MAEQAHFVYILECKDDRYYTGYTTDMARRYQEHLKGSAKSKFTRAFPPIRIAACWQISSRSLALQIEYFIKQLAREEKVALVAEPKTLVDQIQQKSTIELELNDCLNQNLGDA